jgi:acetyl-CoA carboxylase carboxyl transferase subunit beta
MGNEISIGRWKRKSSDGLPEPFSTVTDTECRECHHEIKRAALVESLQVCPECGFHMPMHPYDRIAILVDDDSFREFSQDLTSMNPISLDGYEEKLSQAQDKSGIKDAVVTGCHVLSVPWGEHGIGGG